MILSSNYICSDQATNSKAEFVNSITLPLHKQYENPMRKNISLLFGNWISITPKFGENAIPNNFSIISASSDLFFNDSTQFDLMEFANELFANSKKLNSEEERIFDITFQKGLITKPTLNGRR